MLQVHIRTRVTYVQALSCVTWNLLQEIMMREEVEARRGERGKRRGRLTGTETRLKFPLQLLVAHLLEMCVYVYALTHTYMSVSVSDSAGLR